MTSAVIKQSTGMMATGTSTSMVTQGMAT